MLAASAAFLGYLAFLWWQSRQLHFVRYREFGIPMPVNYEIHGIDVSRYQQRISWEAVKAMQVKDIRLGFAFIKATEGNGNLDPYFRRNWKKAKEAGIVRGAYHFFIASKDGHRQAQNFISKVELESGDLPPVLDVEQTHRASAEEIRREVKKWLEALEEHYNIKPIIYTNVVFYDTYLKGYFDDYPLWVAHYLQPQRPRIRRDWVFWQHSEAGRVNGILSRVDFNVFNGDSAAFKSLLVP
ncbi:glycoside hydrolase family 25 protein [Paraflavisolibacter sp. H34]|uniref:glycoside hydrolase family 25 protein n=1 Tax=Huijunlia imazamoxiresistens TaxID=3127457 RepID=UPI00301A35DB